MIIVPGGRVGLVGDGGNNEVATFTDATQIQGEANLTFDGSTLTVTGAVTVGSDGSGQDVIFYSGTAGDNLTWDASEEVLQITGTDGATSLDVLDGDVRVVDKLYFYDRGGEYLSSNGSTLTITGATTIAGAVDLGSNTLTSTGSMQIRTIDYSDGDLAMTINNTGTVTFAQTVSIGDGGGEPATNIGLLVDHNATSAYPRLLNVGNGASAIVVSSGGNVELLQVYPASTVVNASVTAAHVYTASFYEPRIDVSATSAAVTTAATVYIEGAATQATNNYALWVDAGASRFDGATQFGVDDIGANVTFFGATSGRDMMWDEAANRLEFKDNTYMSFGTGADVQLYHTGTNFVVDNNTGVMILDNGSGAIRMTTTGNVYIGDTANAGATLGLTINQGAADDEIFTLKSSDVAHGITGQTETDTYGLIKKRGGADGGLYMWGLTEAIEAIGFVAGYTTSNTSKSVSGRGGMDMDIYKKDGTGFAAPSSNDNIVVIKAGATARFIFDAEGDLHLDGGGGAGSADPTADHSDGIIGYNVYDDQADWQMARAIHASLVPETDFGIENQKLVERFRPLLETRGIVNYNDDGHHFIASKKLALFQLDGLYQIGEAVIAMAKVLQDAGMPIPENVNRLLELEGA